MDLIETQVFCEDTNQMLTLTLTREEFDRANSDSEYLSQLMSTYNEVRQESIEATIMGTTEDAMDTVLNRTQSSEDNSLFIWTTAGVLLLLTIYEDRKEDFNSGSKRHKKIWEEIAEQMKLVDEKYKLTGAQCQSKLNSLKRTYKKILDHNNKSGNDRATWPYFDKMNDIFSTTGWALPPSTASTDPSESSTSQQESPKPKKTDVIEKYLREMKEERQRKLEEKENRRKEKEEKRDNRFKMLLELRERQHKEKMQLIEHLLSRK